MDLREQKESKVPVSFDGMFYFYLFNNTNLLVLLFYCQQVERVPSTQVNMNFFQAKLFSNITLLPPKRRG